MRRIKVAWTCVCTVLALASAGAWMRAVSHQQPPGAERRMSFHNRLLLNRAVLAGLRSMEVLLLIGQHRTDRGVEPTLSTASAVVTRLGGRVVNSEPEIGYLRIELPPERLVELVASPTIDAYQISSLSRGSWYRDGPPRANAAMYRGYEVTPISAPIPVKEYADLPELTPAEARAPGFTADDDVGVGEWMKNHPAFDGRGVTIAILENAFPAFADPVFRTAKMLDGREVPKIAGIVNAIPREHDDETRVRLNTVIEATTSWTRVGNRTYVLPRSGKYRMGILELAAGGNAFHRFGVLLGAAGEVWLDTNGDGSFQDEASVADVHDRFEPRVLKVTFPQRLDVSFVMARGSEPNVVHFYLGRGGHQSMTASVAAGSRTAESLASGVAPNARLLLVRMNDAGDGIGKIVEGFIEAAQRKEVDVLTSATGLHLIPDTSADFVGLLFSRLTATYKKPIVSAAGNFGLLLGGVQAHGGALSVGGTLGPATYSAFYGGASLPALIVHPWSSAGPAIDGAIKPDFLAPMERIAANPPWQRELERVPDTAPSRRLPPGYVISCCTSASSPYAAGVIALLISAARQSNVPYSVETLNRALRVTARPIPGFQGHQQGNGALDVEAAWRELASGFFPPRITASALIVHPLAQYSARGADGVGILEFGGWTAGMKGSRVITLKRESGPAEPVSYRLVWTAHDGTFSTPSSVTLPLHSPVPLRVDIDVRAPGAHSGLLTLHDRASGAVVFRTQATILATDQIDPSTRSVTVTGSILNMQQNAHYLHVPPGVGAIAVDLEVSRGVLGPTLVQSHGLASTYYTEVHPMDVFWHGPGSYHLMMPNPEPGTWTVRLKNASMKFPAKLDFGPRSDQTTEYKLRMRVMHGSIHPTATAKGVRLELTNRGSILSAPAIEAWSGTRRTHRGSFRHDGLPGIVEIAVPPGAAALSLDLRPENTPSNVELLLYDCTTGECFSYDVGFPAAQSQKFLVRRPVPGRWVAAVNPAPFPVTSGGFVVEEVITAGTPIRRSSAVPRPPGASWHEVFEELPQLHPVEDRTSIVVFELLDAAAERREAHEPWSRHPNFVRLRDRPVAVATAVYQR